MWWVRRRRTGKFRHACARVDAVRVIANGKSIEWNVRRFRSLPHSIQNGWRLEWLWDDNLSSCDVRKIGIAVASQKREDSTLDLPKELGMSLRIKPIGHFLHLHNQALTANALARVRRTLQHYKHL